MIHSIHRLSPCSDASHKGEIWLLLGRHRRSLINCLASPTLLISRRDIRMSAMSCEPEFIAMKIADRPSSSLYDKDIGPALEIRNSETRRWPYPRDKNSGGQISPDDNLTFVVQTPGESLYKNSTTGRLPLAHAVANGVSPSTSGSS